MDREYTKSELQAEKTDIDTRIATLQTKDGADAFVAERKSCIRSLLKDSTLPTSGPITMKELMTIELDRLERSANQVIEAQISRLEKREVELRRQIEAFDDETRPTESEVRR